MDDYVPAAWSTFRRCCRRGAVASDADALGLVVRAPAPRPVAAPLDFDGAAQLVTLRGGASMCDLVEDLRTAAAIDRFKLGQQGHGSLDMEA